MIDNTTASESSGSLAPDFSGNIEIAGLKELKNRVLQIVLTFHTTEFGDFTVKGFRVGSSINYAGYWVQPPSVKVFGFYHKLFRAEETVWRDIESLLSAAYREHFPPVEGDTINLDDVDLGDGIAISK